MAIPDPRVVAPAVASARLARALVAAIDLIIGSCLLMCTEYFLGGLLKNCTSLRSALQDRNIHVQAGGAADRGCFSQPNLYVRHEAAVLLQRKRELLIVPSLEYCDAVETQAACLRFVHRGR